MQTQLPAREAEIEVDGFETVEESASTSTPSNWEASASPVQIPMMEGSTLNPASAGTSVDPVEVLTPEPTFFQSVMALAVRLGHRAKAFGEGILAFAASVAVITKVLMGGACYLAGCQVEGLRIRSGIAFAELATARAKAAEAKAKLKQMKLEQKMARKAAKDLQSFEATAAMA